MRNDATSLRSATTADDIESEVLRRYGNGAQQAEAGLCCPTTYEKEYLDLLPREILEKDYGCGNPSEHVREGETVVDLGSGAGKICYILSQKVGPQGSVIGVDFNDRMLNLARSYQDEMARRIGHGNVRFVKGKIQDLALDLDLVNAWLERNPIDSADALHLYDAECERLRREHPMIADNAVDVVVSNCVLNLVRPQDKVRLFSELHRVLRKGGRAVISDIVCDEEPTEAILNDPELWSGCISGAFREDTFLQMFANAGFYGIEILSRQEEPWHVIDGIEFRSMTVQAVKGKEGPCLERKQAVVYRGPWKCVVDDDGHTFMRGQRAAVCDKTYTIMTDPHGPYGAKMIGIQPREPIALPEAPPFDCARDNTIRHPRETKGDEYKATLEKPSETCCGPDGCC